MNRVIFVTKSEDGARCGKQRKIISRHSSDALVDKAAHLQHEVGNGAPLGQAGHVLGPSASRLVPSAVFSAKLRASSSVASATDSNNDQYKSLDRFGSLDSSDTFLSCATHPYPSQGSLAGLEELAAVGSMAPNGSMPTVNIPSFNSHQCYVNPFDPTSCKKGQQAKRSQLLTASGALTPSPQGSPQSRRVRIGGRSVSSDVELADFESDFSAANANAYHEEARAAKPKHRRARVSHQATSNGSSKPKPRFELDNASDAAAVTALANLDDKDAGLVVGEMMMAAEASEEGGKRRPSYMPTRGLAAMLNQGLATLGEKLGKNGSRGNISSVEALDMKVRKVSTDGQPASSSNTTLATEPASVTSNGGHSGSRKKSILKKSDLTPRGKDPEMENLLVSDQDSTANNTPASARKQPQPAQPLSIADLPPTDPEEVNALTGPKLRVSSSLAKPNSSIQQPKGKPILVNSCVGTKNNGSVASKEIQTSTISLLALASAAAAAAQAERDKNSKGDTNCEPDVFRCPNDMCRHNKVSSALTGSASAKRKICLCGRTMVKQNGTLLHASLQHQQDTTQSDC